MIMKECNSAAWLAEVKRRVAKLEFQLNAGNLDGAIVEVLELTAASQILYGEIVNEQSGKVTG